MNETLNIEMLEELELLMEDDFPVLLETFLAESQRQFLALHDAWQGEDMEVMRRAAHSLKGSCGNIGAETLAALCADLERGAKDGIRPVPEMLTRIEREVGAVQGALRERARPDDRPA